MDQDERQAAPAPGGRDERFELVKRFARLGRQDAYGSGHFVGGRLKYTTHNESLTEEVLRAHLNGGPPVALYVFPAGAQQTRLLVFDLDNHEGEVETDEVVRDAAIKLRDAAKRRGLNLLPVRSGGGCGIHLAAFWYEPQSGADVRALAKAILKEIGFKEGTGGVAKRQIEIIPKQNGVEVDGYGSLIAVPFARQSVPLDDDMQPVEHPLEWRDSALVPAAEKRKKKVPAKRVWSEKDIDRLGSALRSLEADDYNTWVRFGLALHHDLGEDGFAIWSDWSGKSAKYDERSAYKTWQSFERGGDPENPVTCGSIFYEAEQTGWLDPDAPRPMGFTDANGFVLYDPTRRSIITYSPEQLAKPPQMAALAGPYWQRRFPSEAGFGFSIAAVAQWIIERCKLAGPFSGGTIRGRGVWRDGDQIVVNVEHEPTSGNLLYRYTCFEPIHLPAESDFDAKRLLQLVQRFSWRDHNHAVLVLGWIATTPICGMLDWRPHIWPYGPAGCGKTTLTQVLTEACAPMALSALGGSSAAGIRQAVKKDARAIILDDMDQEDEGQRQIREVLRLMRLASSADQTLLRGTADHSGQEFQVAGTFAITAINPCAMEAADESRTVLMPMLAHEQDLQTDRFIRGELNWLRSQRGRLCRAMIERTGLLPPSIHQFIDAFAHLPHQRQRQNFATLMGAAWVALYGTVPTPEEATEQALRFEMTAEAHGEAFQRDPGQECLEFLFAHPVRTSLGEYPLRHWIGVAYHGAPGTDCIEAKHADEASKQIEVFGLKLREGAEDGLCVRNNHPAINAVFARTKWATGWVIALRQIEGAKPLDPTKWPDTGRKNYRGTLLPADLIPEPIVVLENEYVKREARF